LHISHAPPHYRCPVIVAPILGSMQPLFFCIHSPPVKYSAGTWGLLKALPIGPGAARPLLFFLLCASKFRSVSKCSAQQKWQSRNLEGTKTWCPGSPKLEGSSPTVDVPRRWVHCWRIFLCSARRCACHGKCACGDTQISQFSRGRCRISVPFRPTNPRRSFESDVNSIATQWQRCVRDYFIACDVLALLRLVSPSNIK